VLVRQPKTAVFQVEIEVRIYRRPVLKVLIIHIQLEDVSDQRKPEA